MKRSITSEDGLIVPVIVNKGVGYVHHRFRACKELGIPLQYHIRELKDLLTEKQFVIEINLNRRRLLEGIEGEMAKKREISALKRGYQSVIEGRNRKNRAPSRADKDC